MRNRKSNLILFRTPKEVMDQGATVMDRGEGVFVYDTDGKKYLDLVSGVTRPVHIGYGNRELAQAIYDQAARLAYFTPIAYSNPPAEALARVLADLTPGGLERFIFVCDGSEAVETAMKLARQRHACRGEKQRFKIISRRGAYHGVATAALRALGTLYPMRLLMEPLPPGAVFLESPYCYRCPLHLEHPACDLACARDLARLIEFEGPDLISAFIGEPIQQGFGALAPPEGYWPLIRDICARYGVLLIIDEVICGFGRTGKWFGVEHCGIEPDLMTMAKGLTSGYVPLGAVGAAEAVIEPIEFFEHLHTYGNHPVSCAAALKNLEIMKREDLVGRSAAMGRYFLERLREFEDLPIVGQVRGTGLWLGIDLTADKRTKAPLPPENIQNIVARAKAKGLVIKMMGPALELAPPLIIQPEEIDHGVGLLRECLWEEGKELGRSG
ncbi:MAG: aspartate aminotransferase family protein [Thermodesulfobacteriota bacterium]